MYIAHINDETGEKQSVKAHCENVAVLSSEYSIAELKKLNYICGLLHDIGKYQNSFQLRIAGKNIRVEHSTCGAKAAYEKYAKSAYPMALILEYCITGHHSGLPDGGNKNDTCDLSSLAGRMSRDFEDFSDVKFQIEYKKHI